ncbi:ABC transporter ATP-binding protein [Asticcacaulis sp.]|uniref:ABC transporter ATP-binding protein n=1 Tax=Asticcacaulis sp. TaxID=1872648 RepID=UPI002C8296A6|nr:ABC transporter ATP-binding protein [Asticcacaulis sp.]HTM81729.1 ABC transporter ATP-binding protein [Asticcacaulis sp.]
MDSVISIKQLDKTYKSGHQALKSIDLDIRRGEIFALLGPNGAGKTTLIGVVCGLVKLTGGTVIADGHDITKDYRAARAKIGLVPQELATDMFETVWSTVSFSRGLFGLAPNPAHIEKVLKDLSLWDKKDNKIATLSGGMKRRVLIAKALSHEPKILFLDEPTAGVDVELRRDMWKMIGRLREQGVTIILTTHYIEEAEEMADRIGVINKGEIMLVEEKHALMRKLGQTRVIIGLKSKLDAPPDIPQSLDLSADGETLTFTLTGEGDSEDASVADVLKALMDKQIDFKSVNTKRSSLEDIFVDLVETKA